MSDIIALSRAQCKIYLRSDGKQCVLEISRHILSNVYQSRKRLYLKQYIIYATTNSWEVLSFIQDKSQNKKKGSISCRIFVFTLETKQTCFFTDSARLSMVLFQIIIKKMGTSEISFFLHFHKTCILKNIPINYLRGTRSGFDKILILVSNSVLDHSKTRSYYVKCLPVTETFISSTICYLCYQHLSESFAICTR